MTKSSAPVRAQGIKALAFLVILTSGFLYAAESSNRVISTGEVHSSGVWLGPNQSITQNGGVHRISGSLGIVGGYGRQQAGPYPAHYALIGGHLSSHNVSIGYGFYGQTGGTNEVANTFRINAMQEVKSVLNGGLLVVSNLVVGPGIRFHGFEHSDGRLIVTNLELHADARYYASYSAYRFGGGELTVQNMILNDRTSFSHLGGTLRHTGLLTFAGGVFSTHEGSHVMGQVALKQTATNSNSTIAFRDGRYTVRFQPSHSQRWDTGAALRIRNWAGLPAGNGEHQVFFGENAEGLTSEQLAQIRFIDPRGHPPGAYDAAMLDSGELVARVDTDTPASISYTYYSDEWANIRELQLTWRPGYILQAATNMAGPFEDLATSSSFILQVNADEAARFFRLRQ